jgi:hypothetical protein
MRTIEIGGVAKYLEPITTFNWVSVFIGVPLLTCALKLPESDLLTGQFHALHGLLVVVVCVLLAPPLWLSWLSSDPIRAVFSRPAFCIYIYVALLATLGSVALVATLGSRFGFFALPAEWDRLVARWDLIAFLQMLEGFRQPVYLVCFMVPVAISAAIALRRLSTCDIAPFGVSLCQIMSLAGEDLPEKAVLKCSRVSPTRGWLLLAGGAVVVIIFPPLMSAILGCYLLLRARANFQPMAESLLSVDQRPPIVFLRSFSDDGNKWLPFLKSTTFSLFDFSLESRLTGHFAASGPFIAVSRDHETPPAGAARAYLSDDKWRGEVEQWMQSARLIILVAGTTKGVNWELEQVVSLGYASKLIVLFPEAGSRSDAAPRFDKVESAFRGKPWERDLLRLDDPARIRSLTFGPNGEVTAVCGKTANRNECHLAVLLSEQVLMQPERFKDAIATSHNAGQAPIPILGAPELLERRA